MAFICSPGYARPTPAYVLSYLSFLFLLLATPPLLAGSGAPSTAPTARRIAPQTVVAQQTQTLTVNGSFTNTLLTYYASLSDGSPLPSWIKFDPLTAAFTIAPPAAAVGQLHQVAVTATNTRQQRTTVNFYLLIDYNRYICNLDANTDRLGRILDCTTGTATLRGHTSTGTYRWTGPNGFTSTEAEPSVTVAGLYQLTTLTEDGSSCPRRSIVEVRNHRNNCVVDNNRIPKGHILTERTTFDTNDGIELRADGSTDADGDILSYRWSWDGGQATGPTPTLRLPKGKHEVVLTVMDNEGAKSTDRVLLQVEEVSSVANYWLEAECATVGDNWTIHESSSAAAGSYVASPLTSMHTAPAAAPENYVRFSAFAERGGAQYHLMARVAARSNQHDSYWLRVNGGTWTKWNNGFKLNAGFQWVAHPTKIELREGHNTVDFAYREPDTRLDKVLLSLADDIPTGEGEPVVGCQQNAPPMAKAAASSYLGVAPMNVTLDASGSTDPNDNIYTYAWAWEGGAAEGIIAQRQLGVGNYDVTLTVTDTKGASDTDVIAIQVDAPPPSPTNGPEFWLEAECAAVGSAWSTGESSAASNGKYVVVRSGNSYSAPPANTVDNRIRFVISSPIANVYHLFARINAPSNLDDSYYIRLNDGDWQPWKSGIAQGDGFRWNRLPGQLELRAGTNTVDFAYREDGAQLDKLYLSPVQNGAAPQGFGETGTNCGTPADIWMEAECAELAGNWVNYKTTAASRNLGVAFVGQNDMNVPTTTDRQISFPVFLEQGATYHLFLRMNAFDRGHNSVWVKVDGGSWIKFWREVGGAELLTQGHEWRKVNHDGKDRSFKLAAGQHTITIANREAGTEIDKLYLSPADVRPSGYGGKATNCSTGTSREMGMMSFATTAPEDQHDYTTAPELNLFPNPTTAAVTLTLRNDYEGRVRVVLTDASGRRLRTLRYHKQGEHLRERIQVTQLPAGMYHLTILQGDRQVTQRFVKD